LPNEIDKAKEKAVKELSKHIDEMGSAAYAIMLKAIEDVFDIKGGKIVGNKDFIKQLNKLTVQVLDLLQTTPEFSGAISQFVKRMNPISEAITDFQKETNGIKVPDFEVQKKIVIDETIEQMLGNGLNQNFVQPLRDLIYQNVTGGLSLSDARTAIKDYIQGGKDVSGKLGRYIEQTAQQSVDSYSGMINKKILDTFKMDTLLMTGTLIDNSSPQCKFVYNELDKKLTKEKWPEFEKIAKKNGLIEGTTFETMPINLAHWGCRHGWYPIKTKTAA